MKRKDLVPKLCSRCGNFLWNGYAVFWLPFEKRYIVFCNICCKGLEIEQYYVEKPMTEEELKEFWNSEVKKSA